ncbi:GNAT family N-acetyltransferase [Acidovorax sp.]|uniref:GNAT family N-acetyltransferase n=1 Tax=Acidovorax sp. TaxID=1872122 RepID=UPI004037ED5C
MARLAEATDAAALVKVRELFAEYARLVDEPCCFVDFQQELDSLPGAYRLFLLDDGAGCVALRLLGDDTTEMKRLYVRQAHRGKGYGRVLAEAAIAAAREAGCARIVLDTLPKMHEAQALYRALHFRPIGSYLANPTPGALCFELSLS